MFCRLCGKKRIGKEVPTMTAREQAHSRIESLPDDSVRAVVEIMIRMQPRREDSLRGTEKLTPKMKAFLELERLKEEGTQYSISPDDRSAALEEKYGSFMWTDGTQ